jgi:hypothetical protein
LCARPRGSAPRFIRISRQYSMSKIKVANQFLDKIDENLKAAMG